MTISEWVSVTEKVAWPWALVVPEMVVTTEPDPALPVRVTTWPETGVPLASSRVTTTLEDELPLSATEVGVATANLYPNISLTGVISQDALTPQSIFSKVSNSYNFGPALTLPIFHSGELHARKRQAEDAARAALLVYEETVLEAFAQVDDALQAIAHDNQAYEDQTRVLDLAQTRLDMARKSFAAGGITARQLLAAQKALVQAQLDLQQNGSGRYADAARLMLAVAHVPPGAAAGTRTP